MNIFEQIETVAGQAWEDTRIDEGSSFLISIICKELDVDYPEHIENWSLIEAEDYIEAAIRLEPWLRNRLEWKLNRKEN